MNALAFRNLLEAGDVDGCRAFFAANAAHLPQAETREQSEIIMHRARTEAASVSLRARAWSHRWLSAPWLCVSACRWLCSCSS